MIDLKQIRYIRRDELEITKWDQCIESSSNGLLYAQSTFLDHISKGWDALILGDYDTVMPLTWKRKLGIRYLYQPPFAAQTGIFGKDHASIATTTAFLDVAKSHFAFAEIFVNYGNASMGGVASPNFVLSMNKSYEQTRKEYSDGLVKSLKVANKGDFDYVKGADYAGAVSAYKSQYGAKLPHITTHDYDQFIALCSVMNKTGNVVARELRAETLLASIVMLKDKNRLYNIISTVSPEGRRRGANHFLFDALIREYSEQSLTLDFEGSSLAGVAAFFRSFGAFDQPRYYVRYNHLPWPVRLLKR